MKTKLFTLLVALMVGLTGCSDFLEEVDKDKLIPSKTEHYASVLLNCHRYDYPVFTNVDYMADNINEYSASTSSNRNSKKPVYTWQIEIELDENGSNIGGNNLWEKAYKNIAIANYVIELIDEADGTLQENNFTKGEAYFVRAINYFNLLNIYGVPYDAATASHSLGVPLRLNNGVEQNYQRNTVAECYAQIESDLDQALSHISSSDLKKSQFHASEGACYLLLSRVYLYQQKWSEAADAATQAMTYGSLMRMPTSGEVVYKDNVECLYSGMFYSGSLTHVNFEGGWMVNSELLALFDTERDLRFANFFTKSSDKVGSVYYSNKGESSFSTLGQVSFRLAEAYLTRAEAYIRLGEYGKARTDMNTLLVTRYKRPTDFTIPADDATLLSFVLTERRKELCFEEHHRWFDLRRMGAEAPTLVHTFTLTDNAGTSYGTQTYTLYPGELNYTLPIPLEERENNPLIQNNERYDKLPETDSEIII